MVQEIPPESRNSLVRVKIGNQVYDARHDNRCKVCTHPARTQIEIAIVQGWAYTRIEREYSNVEYTSGGQPSVLPAVGWQSIRHHFRTGHMPLSAEIRRRLTEQRAQEIGSKYEEAASQFVDHYTVAQAVLVRGHERLVAGELEPDLKDTLAAAKFLKEIEDAAQGTLNEEAWSQAMTIYFETAQELMSPDTWQSFVKKLSTNPVLASLARKIQGQEEEPIEIEYTEEPVP